MHEQILEYIKNNPEPGVSSIAVAQEFLKFKNPPYAIAHQAVMGILKNDRRCTYGEDSLWHWVKTESSSTQSQDLSEKAFCAVYCLSGKNPAGQTALVHLTVHSIEEHPECMFDMWTLNPQTLSHDDALHLGINVDIGVSTFKPDENYSALSSYCNDIMPVFLRSQDHALLCRNASLNGTVFTDNVLLISTLFIAAGFSAPRPLTLEHCYYTLLGRQPRLETPNAYGFALAECILELKAKMLCNGIETLADLNALETNSVTQFDYTGKDFGANDIIKLPETAGVYAFKKNDGTYLYIGKSTNVRKRIMSYFGQSEESPKKLEVLRRDAHSLILHECGSDLESLLYEYRLIQKYSPQLNSKIAVNERKGTYYPLQDCIILLPHSNPDRGLSCWYRKDQKILLKTFHLHMSQNPELVAELDSFFFSSKLSPSPSDFPEQEIVFRWVKAHEDTCVIVPVFKMADAQEIYAGMLAYWDEVYPQ